MHNRPFAVRKNLHLQAGFEVQIVGLGCMEYRSTPAPAGRLQGAIRGSEVYVFPVARQIMTAARKQTVSRDNL